MEPTGGNGNETQGLQEPNETPQRQGWRARIVGEQPVDTFAYFTFITYVPYFSFYGRRSVASFNLQSCTHLTGGRH